MKAYTRQNKKDTVQEVNLWDAFINHLESVYFAGAADVLDTKTISFEYAQYKNSYAK